MAGVGVGVGGNGVGVQVGGNATVGVGVGTAVLVTVAGSDDGERVGMSGGCGEDAGRGIPEASWGPATTPPAISNTIPTQINKPEVRLRLAGVRFSISPQCFGVGEEAGYHNLPVSPGLRRCAPGF